MLASWGLGSVKPAQYVRSGSIICQLVIQRPSAELLPPALAALLKVSENPHTSQAGHVARHGSGLKPNPAHLRTHPAAASNPAMAVMQS